MVFNLPLSERLYLEAGANTRYPLVFREWSLVPILSLTPEEALALIELIQQEGDGIVAQIRAEQARGEGENHD